jgi:hypothetical protein
MARAVPFRYGHFSSFSMKLQVSEQLRSRQIRALAQFAKQLRPLCEGAISSGVTYQALAEVLRRQLLLSAVSQLYTPSSKRTARTSLLSIATGISRREVERVMRVDAVAEHELLATPIHRLTEYWHSKCPYVDELGSPRVLEWVGGVSFQSLAREITNDVHPRTLLLELIRLNLVEYSELSQRVALKSDEVGKSVT